MCGKMGVDEVDSMQNMMAMSVCFVIADVLDLDAMDLDMKCELEMSASLQVELNDAIMDMFNGCELDFSSIHSIGDIVVQVIAQQPRALH